MDEKDSGRYRYEPYMPLTTKHQNNGMNTIRKGIEPSQSSLKNSTIKKGVGGGGGGGAGGGGGGGGGVAGGLGCGGNNIGGNNIGRHKLDHHKQQRCCTCMDTKAASIWVSVLTNLGICTLLFGYTLLGSFIFLAIEGGASTMHQRTLASTNRQLQQRIPSRMDNVTLSKASATEAFKARQRTVENIWEITVQLNILYRENWTRLAALEIAKFQEHLIKRVADEMTAQYDGSNQPSTGAVMIPHAMQEYDWTFARAFLYSLTVLTTIGYGNIAPRTTLGRIVTLAYAVLGIPLTLIYLSSTGGVLARVARGVFSRALCCCLCSNCGYCCYDEKRMADKERRMKKKRQQEELRSGQHLALQEPYYVRSNSMHNNNMHSPDKHIQISDMDTLSASESRTSMHGLSLLAPILLCFGMMVIYILLGALALVRLEDWSLLDGIYFCFMSLSTIGFGDLVPGLRKESTSTTWFCSIYIMSGMALTAMCFNVLHEEIIHRIKHVVVDVHHSNNKKSMIGGGGGVGGGGGSSSGISSCAGGIIGGGGGGQIMGVGGGNNNNDDNIDYLGS